MQIALVGKYVRLHDAYLSVAEALSHAGYAMGAKVNIRWINSEILEEEKPDLDEVFAGVDGIVVPGGFGYRGVEGKIDAIRYARENKIPFLGSASVCSAPLSNLPETCATWNKPTLPNSFPTGNIPSSISCPIRKTSRKKAVPCASASIRAS